MSFENKSVLITGASRGLGRALAEELGRRGAKLALVARNGGALDEIAAHIRAGGGHAHAIAADVGQAGAAARIAGEAAAVVGPIDVLIHNASDLGPVPLALLLDTEGADFARAYQVNVLGPFALSKALIGPMVLRGAGTVVHISSDAAVNAYERWGAYGSSKAGFDHLARIWAAELASSGVRVFSVDPGEMDTKMHRDAIPEADPATLKNPAEVAAKIAELIGSAANGARIAL